MVPVGSQRNRGRLVGPLLIEPLTARLPPIVTVVMKVRFVRPAPLPKNADAVIEERDVMVPLAPESVMLEPAAMASCPAAENPLLAAPEPNCADPLTSKVCAGPVVPTPTLPVAPSI